MSMLAEFHYYQSGLWADVYPRRCLCRGSGWWLSDLDTYHQCPIHNVGQPHPEDHVYEQFNDQVLEGFIVQNYEGYGTMLGAFASAQDAAYVARGLTLATNHCHSWRRI